MSPWFTWLTPAIPLLLPWLVRDGSGMGQATVCSRWDRSVGLDDRGLFQEGEVVIGGLIPFHNLPPAPDLSFSQPPDLQACVNFQEEPLQWAHALVFAVDEINRNPFLLPGVQLGYRILDSCNQHPWSLRGALSLLSGGNIRSRPSSDCPVPLVIGDASSTQTIILSRTLGPLSVPVISYQASCGCLSDKQEFPNFFRTIPSDVYQALTMARLTWLLGWTWVGAIAVDNDYGRLAIQVFEEEIRGTGVCLAFFETLNRANLVRDVKRAADTVQASTARVILVFLWYTDMGALLLELGRRNVTDRQFLASEAWSTSGQLLRNPALFNVAQGVVGVAIRSAPIPGFEAHLRSLNPSRRPGDVLLKELWETVFGCSPGAAHGHGTSLLPSPLPPTPSVSLPHTPPPTSSSPHPRLASCSGAETLEGIQSPFTDTSQLRITYNVYLAVYSAAHALHSLLSCPQRDSPTWGSSFTCSLPYNISPAELLQHLNQVNFTTPLGEPFYFRGADVPAVYDLVNWQATPQGLLKLVTIGRVDGSNLLINQSAIQWNTGSNMVPVSVCSDSCPPGTRVARKKGEPVCCFDCISCAEGEVSNTTGSLQCDRCPLEFWSNSHRTACIPRQLEFLSFNDVMGVTLTTVAVCGAVATVAVFMFFVYHRHTPLVRANNSELSFLLLLSLKLCFLCSLVFIGRPSVWACRIRQAAFGVIFVLCLSCLLVKTIVVLAAFRSARPGAGQLMRCFGPVQQRGSVFLFTSVQVIICAVWLSTSPPLPYRDLGLKGSKVILECEVGSVVGFSLVLGYIGLLASLCLLLAFLARKLPDNFNEAKLITFSMLIFCAVWISFVPAYISSPGKYADAVEIFAILASSFGLLLCIFAPKCYIILLRPERNTKKHMMSK
ncbi:extracellular calcium-sensing receptor-like [Oncorhynchus mykiss]|uniref:extracellular calcium-sensing receptor-like n=1 Tax=Oncorhynchus mykiss TaxID=8022 RepID=UPI001877DE73|nr:extracellular calcium-sensing receptor-like [Oncorhynchus mykiss]